MGVIIEDLPFFGNSKQMLPLPVGFGTTTFKKFQIVICCSITPQRTYDSFPNDAIRFPAFLDPGTNTTFALRSDQFNKWATGDGGEYIQLVDPGDQPQSESLRFEAALWLHRNKPGTYDEWLDKPPAIKVPNSGIRVFKPNATNPPRLPTFGLRALADNGLEVQIECRPKQVEETIKKHAKVFRSVSRSQLPVGFVTIRD